MSHEHSADSAMPDISKDTDEKKEHGHGHSHEHAHGDDGAKIVALGAVTLGGATFTIDRDGQVEAGATTEFGVELISGKAVPTSAWLANADGKKTAEPVVAETHDSHWHFNLTPLYPVKKSSLILKVGEEEATIDFARGVQPVADGILSVFKCGDARCGYLELKLHGDAGDLELFLYDRFAPGNCFTPAGGKPKPFDIPKNTVIKITFPTHEGKSVELRIRNDDKNEDEDGNPNMRDGKTNYFIFPGESGQDAEWLIGEKARYHAAISFETDGKSYYCDPFVLVPHEAL